MQKRVLYIAFLLLAICNQIMAEDLITISDIIMYSGGTKEVNVVMTNTDSYVGFQFDMVLPEGITVESFSASERIPQGTSLQMAQQTDGSYRFIAYAQNRLPITGNDGVIMTLTIKASESVVPNSYSGYLRDVKISTVDGTGLTVVEQSFSITVKGAEPYAALSENNTVLTFYYDKKKEEHGGMSVGPFSGYVQRGWHSVRSSIAKVVFDDSFAMYSPTSTALWFWGLQTMTEIIGLENLHTDQVTDMNGMFHYCYALETLDLSNFNTAAVTNIAGMFYGCNKLKTITVGEGWTTDNIITTTISGTGGNGGWQVFSQCTSLVGGAGTKFDASHTDYTYAHIDGGPSNPGYFTNGTAIIEFADAKVKEICIDNWDTNGDGELSTVEAAAVTSLGKKFSGTTITSFDELQYFRGLTVLGEGEFSNCPNLASVIVPEGVTSIGYYGFHGCPLASVTLPSTLTSIGGGAFEGCEKLTSITIPVGVTELSRRVLCGCSSLTSIVLPTSLTTIGESALEGCVSLHEIDIPESVTELGPNAINNTGLTSVTIPAGVTSISERAFMNSAALTSVTSQIVNPYAIPDDVFSEYVYQNAPLFVPTGSVDAYKNTDGWKQFMYILAIGDTLRFPYAVLTDNNTVLTFYYDDQKEARGGIAFLDGTNVYWPSSITSVTQAVFDSSFADFSPTSTANWFNGLSGLTIVTGLEYLNTEHVTDMYGMFHGCSGLTSLDVSGFKTDNVTGMSNMFSGCSGLTSLDVTGFKTDNVEYMSEMFHGCSGLTNLDVSGFKTDNVTRMDYMFQFCSGLSVLDVTGFKTENVTSMYCMFRGCTGLTAVDVSGFNTDKVEYMNSMFADCSGLKTIFVGNVWSTASVTESNEMFSGCTSLVGGMGTVYNPDHIDASYAHIDEGTSNPGYFTDKNAAPYVNPEPYVVLSDNNTVLTFYYDDQKAARGGIAIGSYGPGNYEPWYENRTTLTTAVFDESFANDTTLTSTAYWFHECIKLTEIKGLEYLKTDKVTDMRNMFYGCSKLTTLDVSHLKTDNVTNMNLMFYYCSGLTSLDVTGFNTENVTDMGSMFNNCSGLTSLDISSFRTEKVKNMIQMFYQCYNLTTIYVGNGWSTASVTADYGYHMFTDCTALVGGRGTTYDKDRANYLFAHIDGGASNPGYFTDINGSTLNDGDTFTAVNSDGIELRYRVISAADKTCQVGDKADSNTLSPDDIASAVDTTVVGVINVPEQANGYKVIRVGYQAFVNCRNVTEVVLPNTVTELYLYSFAYSGIKRFTLPRSVSIIHYAALTETDSLETIIVDSENPVFDSRNNCNAIIETASNTLVRGCITSFVPDGITAIGSGAFLSCCAHDWTIELPNSVTRIETQAFNSCDLTDIKLPNNLQYVGYSAFGGSKLTSVVVPASVTEMGIGAFRVNSLTSLVVDEANSVFDSRDNCNAIIETATNTLVCGSNVTIIPNSVTAIGRDAFSELWNLKTITLPSSITRIDDHAFWFSNLETIISLIEKPFEISDNVFREDVYKRCALNVPTGTVDAYRSTSGWNLFQNILEINPSHGGPEPYAVLSDNNTVLTFYYDNQKEVRNGMSVGPFDNEANREWNDKAIGITKVVFDSTFAEFKPTSTKHWFNNFQILTSIDNMNYLNTSEVDNMEEMFINCQSLTNIDLSGFNTAKVKNMRGMFYNCYNLTKLDVSSFNTENVESMMYMFHACRSLTSLDVSNFNTSNVSDWFMMFMLCESLTELDVSGFDVRNTNNVGELFRHCFNLKSVKLFSVNGIEWPMDINRMFDGCSKLRTIYADSSWDSIEKTGDYAFDGCTSLVGGKGTVYDANHIDYTYAHIDGGVSNPGYFTDKNAPVIDDNIIQFADAAVKAICVEKWDADGDGELSKAEAAAVTSLNKAFNQNDDIISFEEFQYFTGVTMLVEWEFHDCSNLKKIVLPPHLQSIEDHAFYYCGIDSIVLPASVTNITDAGMYGCFKNIDVDADNPMFCSIDGVLFSKDATVIRNYPVRRYDESYTVPSTVTAIGGCAFYGSRLREIVVPDGVTRFEAGAFRYCRELENIVIPATVDSIFSENFQYCDVLTSVMIPANVKYMADDVLADCSNLKEILVDADNQNYRSLDGVLYDKDVTRLRIYPANYQTESYVVPDGVTSMSFFAFNRAENIQAITLPQSLTNISRFGDSKNLTSVTVHWQEPLTLGANTDYFHENTLTNGTLYVPYGTKSLYEQTEGWNKFQNIVEMEAPAVNATFDNHGVLTVGGTATMAEALETVGGVSAVAETVTAVVWNSTATLTNSDLQDLDNPNMLVYVPSEMQAPVNRDNVIIGNDSTGYTAKNIVLTDVESGNQNFYCPKAFVAEMITYAHDYLQQTEVGVSRGWETIALPFTVQTIMHEKQGVIAPFGNDASNKHFWLRQLMMQGLTRATVIEANMPYLIAMPNSDAYAAEFNLNGRVTFSSQNVEVPQTQMNVMEAHDANDNMMMFVPCFQAQPQGQEIYALNVGEQRDNHPEGSVFEANYREVRPFEAYTVHTGEGPAPRFVLITEIGGTTGIEDVRGLMSDDRGENWYDLNGRRLQSKPSQKGVYLHDGRKVVIR